jgi:hypothetical protein
MYLVVRPIPTRSIVSRKPLGEEEHRQLADRVHAFRFRSRIEAGQMENVKLDAHNNGERAFLRYRGPWFVLDSTADDETTRRCVVRIEQIFRAYRQILPPRVEPASELRVLILGSMDEYQQFVKDFNIEIENPAFFAARVNVIVGASELTRYADRLKKVRGEHEKLRQRYEATGKALPKQLADLGKRLREQGIGQNEIQKEIDARKSLWEEELAQAMQQINAADRRNESRFAEVTDEMFRRLYHEGLHAYLENYVYPHDSHDVPIWLHEGLAQVFQSGQLDADTLRIDAPLVEALRIVQDDLKSDNPLLLEDVLAAPRRDFLAGPQADNRAARLYAHAWALTYSLTFYEPALGTAAMDEYVSLSKEQEPAIARFEKLIRSDIGKFESRWREAILELKP